MNTCTNSSSPCAVLLVLFPEHNYDTIVNDSGNAVFLLSRIHKYPNANITIESLLPRPHNTSFCVIGNKRSELLDGESRMGNKSQ